MQRTDRPLSTEQGRPAEPGHTGQRRSRRALLVDVLIGGAIGLVMACVIFDRSFFWGDEALVLGIQGDAGSSFAGFRAYIADSWHFPLLETDNLTNRQGEPTVIAFTDSLPLLGLTAKMLGFLGISANTWIALWYYGNIVAQGAAAGLVAHTHRVSSRWTTAAMAAMAVTAPVMIMRVWHPGLYSHVTILLLWAVAGKFWRQRSLSAAWWFVPVVALSLLTHPYVFVMNGVVAAGIVLAATSQRWLSVRHTVQWFAVTPVVLLSLMYLLGYLPSDAIPPGGYGAFGMPVVSPFWPQWSGWWPGDEWILLNRNQSFEGINYLGAGGVLAVVAGAAVSWRRLLRFVIDQQVLLVFAALLTAVAITHRVYFWTQEPYMPLGPDFEALVLYQRGPMLVLGTMALAGFALFIWSWRSSSGAVIRPATTTLAVISVSALAIAAVDRGFFLDHLQQFRASGRFFWVIGYGLSLGGIILIDRWFAAKRSARPTAANRSQALLGLAMVAIVGVQVYDTGQYRDFVPNMFLATPERVELIEALGTVISAHDEVQLTPDWFCTTEVNEALTEFQDTVIAATANEIVINGYYGGRTETDVECPTKAAAPGGDVLTVVVRPIHFLEFIDVGPAVECRYSQHMALCSSRWDQIDPTITERFALVPLPWPPP